jgi:site-specific recombinase XerD
MKPIAPHISAFLRDYLPNQCGASEHTCDSYAYAFKLLLQYASQRLRRAPSAICIEQLDAPLIMDFLHDLERTRNSSPQTRNARLAAIKSFMRFVEYREPALIEQTRSILAIPAKRKETKLVNYLSMEEMKAVLNAPNLKCRSGIRDRAMMHVCLSAGLRVSELVGLTLGSIEWEPSPSVHVHGKGRRERLVPLWKDAASDLRAWLAVRGKPPTDSLFVNAGGQQMTRSGFEHILEKSVRAADQRCSSLHEKKVTPHVLRHTSALLVLQATNGDIRKVSLWLGHSTIQTTEVYLRADPTEKLEAVRALVPPSLKHGRFRPPDKLIALLDGA